MINHKLKTNVDFSQGPYLIFVNLFFSFYRVRFQVLPKGWQRLRNQ